MPKSIPFNSYLQKLIRDSGDSGNGGILNGKSQECHVTLTHFRRIFKEVAGMAPLQFLLQCRLQKAADLLIHTTDSVGRVAELSGIENPFYFSRLFKEKFYISPLEYRQEFSE